MVVGPHVGVTANPMDVLIAGGHGQIARRLIRILSQHTGKPEEQVRHDSDRDYYMSASEAKTYGLVDEVIKSRKEAKLLDGVSADKSLNDRSTAVAEAALPQKVEE